MKKLITTLLLLITLNTYSQIGIEAKQYEDNILIEFYSYSDTIYIEYSKDSINWTPIDTVIINSDTPHFVQIMENKYSSPGKNYYCLNDKIINVRYITLMVVDIYEKWYYVNKLNQITKPGKYLISNSKRIFIIE